MVTQIRHWFGVVLVITALVFALPVYAAGTDAPASRNCPVSVSQTICNGANAYGGTAASATNQAIGVAGNAIDNTSASVQPLIGVYASARVATNHAASPNTDAAAVLAGVSCSDQAASCGKATDVVYVGCDPVPAGYANNRPDGYCALTSFSTQAHTNIGIALLGTHDNIIVVQPGKTIVLCKAAPCDGSVPANLVPEIQMGADGTLDLGPGGQYQMHPDGSTDVYGYVTFHAGHN